MAVVKNLESCALLNAADLLSPGMPERFVELIEGELIETSPADWEHNRISYLVMNLFQRHCEAHADLQFGGLGDGFLISRNPDTMFVSDACLFRKPLQVTKPWRKFAPEIWVEVLSPSNSAAEMAFKRHRLFDAGTRQFWMVEPEKRTLEILHADNRRVAYSGDESVTCEGLAEGLVFPLSAIFSER